MESLTMTQTLPEHRIKMLKMRSWRRGMKEMDLILGPFSDQHLIDFSDQQLDLYEKLLTENDQEMYLWFCGHTSPKEEYVDLVDLVAQAQGLTP